MQTAVKGTVLITGASSGIGMEFAKQLAAKGFDLIVASRSTAVLEKLKEELTEKYPIQVHVLTSDLSKPGSAQELYHQCRIKNLPVDMLINNAGAGLFGVHLDQKQSDVTSMLNLNMLSLTELCMLFGHDMRTNKTGRILNVASMVGLFPSPYFTAYAASKSYVYNYTLALRSELKSAGVKVTCLLPGFVNTNFDKAAQVKESAFQKVAHAAGMTPAVVARVGIKAMLAGKAQVVPGFGNSVMAACVGLIPKVFMSDRTVSLMRGLSK